MDLLVEKCRRGAWARLIKAYSPNLVLATALNFLGFEDETEGLAFVQSMRGVLVKLDDEAQCAGVDVFAIDTRASRLAAKDDN